MSRAVAAHLSPETVVAPSEKTLPAIAWATLLVGLWPVGLVIAYLEEGKCNETTRSHYHYLKRTCLIGLPAILLSTLLMVVLIGFPMTLALSIWYLARCVKALIALHKGEAIANPRTWLV